MFDLSSITTGFSEETSVIVFETTSYDVNFDMGLVSSDISHTRIAYRNESVNQAILRVDEKVNSVKNNSLLSTLPSAVGVYKYEVTQEGIAGKWTKETTHCFYQHVLSFHCDYDDPSGTIVFVSTEPEPITNLNTNLTKYNIG